MKTTQRNSRIVRILSAKASDPSADTSALELQIDSLVYRLYGLTSAEIVFIESKVKPMA